MRTDACVIEEGEPPLFSPKQLLSLDKQRIPRHVALIMDGNRRWARKRKLFSHCGHHAGAEALVEVVKAASELGIEVITAYSFSTENWKRPAPEIELLFQIFEQFLISQREMMCKEGVRLESIGDIDAFPFYLQKALAESKEATRKGKRMTLVLALNYGGRAEICQAVKKICECYGKGLLQQEDIGEELLSQWMETAAWPPVELLIRTSGEKRSSNFLLWQLHYAEFYFTDVLWPDFQPLDLLEAIKDFQRRGRRTGS